MYRTLLATCDSATYGCLFYHYINTIFAEPHVASNVRYIAFPLRSPHSHLQKQGAVHFFPLKNELDEEFAERGMGVNHISQGGG